MGGAAPPVLHPAAEDAPSRETVAGVHARFVAEIEALFERHKRAAGCPDLKLVVL